MSSYAAIIPDFDLSVEKLEEKYDGLNEGEHPEYAERDWVVAVGNGETRSGYWSWVFDQLVIARDHLDSDNPYTQHLQG